jgi:hypothetical protein
MRKIISLASALAGRIDQKEDAVVELDVLFFLTGDLDVLARFVCPKFSFPLCLVYEDGSECFCCFPDLVGTSIIYISLSLNFF